MIPRARVLSDAFWWGRYLERFYLTYRLLLANEYFDLQSAPGYLPVSHLGWGLQCTGQRDAFNEQSVFMDRLHQWHWWTDVGMPYGLPAIYQQLRQGLRAMRSEFRSEWFEQWSRYQSVFEDGQNENKYLDHPMLHAVAQLYPMMLGLLEIEQGRTLLTTWVRLGVEWERLDMTVRLLILYEEQSHTTKESSRLVEWINYVQDVSVQVVISIQDWLSSKVLLRSLPSIYGRLSSCLLADSLQARLVLPVVPVRCESVLLRDFQNRLYDTCSALEGFVNTRIEYGM